MQRAEYQKDSEEDEDEEEEEEAGSSEECSSGSEEDSDAVNVDSDPENMSNGKFFTHISYETKRAEKERKVILGQLKSKQVNGSIF